MLTSFIIRFYIDLLNNYDISAYNFYVYYYYVIKDEGSLIKSGVIDEIEA